ncbi:leucine rich repeat family protein [Anaeramoeba flamelloides]|uniref:Leucine rich repeat family protein n=1 Tax=Anaeramoeba flamelloides TaxID=1746091 RepID=A0AAV7Z107_9EUKA|nr:leucine rich repeat family protein [Anaeramoeba flamelloides]
MNRRNLRNPKEELFKNNLQRLTLNDQTLTNLDLSHYEIGSEGMEALSECLKANQALTNLDLSNNQIGDEGMKVLSESLKCNQTLTNLDLSYNEIGAKGIQVLCESLKVNQTLINLKLSMNQIVGEGMQAVLKALKANHQFINLNLYRNKIGAEGLKYLSEALKVNQTLTRLDLCGIKLDFIKIKKTLTKSVKVGNLQLFQELIQIEKIPLIYHQSSDDVEDIPNNQEENTIFHTAVFHHQTEILFHLLFANNEKTDQEIISKRNFLLNFKNAKTKKIAIDLLNPNEILIQDFKNYYNQFISSQLSSFSSLSSSTSNFNNNEHNNNNFPNKLIAEKEIILMRIGKEWKTIKNEFQNELTEKQKQLFLKWLYCPVSFNFQEKQIILEIFKLLNINQNEKQTLFTNEKLLNDFQNYITKYANSEKKIFQINLKKK